MFTARGVETRTQYFSKMCLLSLLSFFSRILHRAITYTHVPAQGIKHFMFFHSTYNFNCRTKFITFKIQMKRVICNQQETLLFAEYNQQDATFQNVFIPVRRSTCFRQVFRPLSGAQNSTYSVRYLSDQYCWCDKYLKLYVQFWAPDNGRKTRLKLVQHLTEINKLWNVASCWLYSANILVTHGTMNVKFKRTTLLKLLHWRRGKKFTMGGGVRDNSVLLLVLYSPLDPSGLCQPITATVASEA